LPQVVATLARAEYLYLAPAALGMVAYMAARAVRWRILLGPQVSLSHCFWVTNVGYLVSNVFPFRLGDPARALLVGQSGAVSTGAALSTVVVERVLDMLTVVALLAGMMPLVGRGRAGLEWAVTGGLMAGGIAVIALALLFFVAWQPERGHRVLRWGIERLPDAHRERARRFLGDLFDGLASLRSGRQLLGVLLWSVVTWGCAIIFYWALIRAFLRHPPALAAPLLVCVVGLGMALPSSPGATGVFHAVARYGLTIPFNVPTDPAITAAFGIHAFQYILGCLLGLVGLWLEFRTKPTSPLVWLRENLR
ncbi:MAG: flippase-like domain-containing protein, partial [Anaerolineae bacterium]|nr:flippase-like domain-containing protein [Anaerolineae bacterium]